jgi:hypothetical protein
MSIVGRPLVPFSSCVRLRGLHTGRYLVRASDLQGGEERIVFVGNLVPDVLDPSDLFNVREALAFCESLSGYFGPAIGGCLTDSRWRDLEGRIRRGLQSGEIVLISGNARRNAPYRVHSAAISRAKGVAWEVYGTAKDFLIVRRGDLLPGEQPARSAEIREIIESLAAPEARMTVQEILKSSRDAGLHPAGAGFASGEKKVAPTGDLRARLEVAFQSGELVLVALKRHAGGGAVVDEAQQESQDTSREAATNTHWIEFRVVDVTTGNPVPDLPLEVILANSSKQKCKTNQDGAIRFDDTTPGDCALLADAKDIRLEEAYAFVAVE